MYLNRFDQLGIAMAQAKAAIAMRNVSEDVENAMNERGYDPSNDLGYMSNAGVGIPIGISGRGAYGKLNSDVSQSGGGVGKKASVYNQPARAGTYNGSRGSLLTVAPQIRHRSQTSSSTGNTLASTRANTLASTRANTSTSTGFFGTQAQYQSELPLILQEISQHADNRSTQ